MRLIHSLIAGASLLVLTAAVNPPVVIHRPVTCTGCVHTVPPRSTTFS